jgi:hypothetical protein
MSRDHDNLLRGQGKSPLRARRYSVVRDLKPVTLSTSVTVRS